METKYDLQRFLRNEVVGKMREETAEGVRPAGWRVVVLQLPGRQEGDYRPGRFRFAFAIGVVAAGQQAKWKFINASSFR